MNIKITDSGGQKPVFTQWDSDRLLLITGCESQPFLHFANDFLTRAIVVESEAITGGYSCKVPNFALQFAGQMVVSVFLQPDEGFTAARVVIPVKPKMKPQDYTYTENIGYVNWVQKSAQAQALIDDIQEKLDSGDFKGDKGDAFTYADFTEEQLAALKGPKGDTGDPGQQGAQGAALTWDDLTDEQKASLKGETGPRGAQGPQGVKGEAFTFADFTEEQLASLKGPQGPEGQRGPQGERGLQGLRGETGPQGPSGADGKDAVIDATLTQSGEAADAKVTGDNISAVKDAIGFSDTFEPWPAASDWTVGYVNITDIKHTASNHEIVGTKAVKVNPGETINVNLCFAPSASEVTSPYFYYAWCSDEAGTHLATDRIGYTGRYSRTDENYKYYETTVTVPSGASYFIMSYRDYNEDPTLSSVTINRLTTDIDGLEERQTATEADVAELKTESKRHLFPDDLELPICVAHRGLATAGYPENTIPAYEDAISKGWRYLETDLVKTADDVWVLSHDDTVSGSGGTARNPDGTVITDTVKISETTYEDLLDYDFTCGNSDFAGTKIATLEEFLLLCRRAYAYPLIHVKDSSISQADADAVWEIVVECEMENHIIWGSSSLGGVSRFLEKNPYAPAVNFASAEYEYIDPDTFPTLSPPYVASYETGKNKVFHERDAGRVADKATMDNMVDYYHYFGIGAGVYGPTTQASVDALSDRLDMATTEVYPYSKEPRPSSGGGGGTSNYNDLSNKPQIGGVTLSGNKSLSDLGIAAASDIPSLTGYATETWVQQQGYLTSETVEDVGTTGSGAGETLYISTADYDYSVPTTSAFTASLAAKLNLNQGAAHAGEFCVVGSDGNITTVSVPSASGVSF